MSESRKAKKRAKRILRRLYLDLGINPRLNVESRLEKLADLVAKLAQGNQHQKGVNNAN